MSEEKKPRYRAAAGAALDDGTLAELLYRPEDGETLFAVLRDGKIREEPHLELPGDIRLLPFRPDNSLLLHRVVLFPDEVGPDLPDEKLFEEVRAFIHRYVDLSEDFEVIASAYVLFTWLFDGANELPYLRVRGDWGTGKSRFLLTVGSVSYRPIFASGASTVSPLFRMIDAFRGTLIFDEADFRFSDERAEITKILNNGNARGFPVLRSEQRADTKEFSPRAYDVFGPKVVATRRDFQDQALESRFLSEDLSGGPVRPGIPLNLPDSFFDEAAALRRLLLAFRFRRHGALPLAPATAGLPPRLAQVLAPLLAAAPEAAREAIRRQAGKMAGHLAAGRSMALEAEVLEVVAELRKEEKELALAEIAERFRASHGEIYGNKVSPRWIGGILRRRLHLHPVKSHGTYVIAAEEYPKLEALFERYGVAQPVVGDVGEEGDVVEGCDGQEVAS